MLDDVRCHFCGFENCVPLDLTQPAFECDHCGEPLAISAEELAELEQARAIRVCTAMESVPSAKLVLPNIKLVGVFAGIIAVLIGYYMVSIAKPSDESEARRRYQLKRLAELDAEISEELRQQSRNQDYYYDRGIVPYPAQVSLQIEMGNIESDLAIQKSQETTRIETLRWYGWGATLVGAILAIGNAGSLFFGRNSSIEGERTDELQPHDESQNNDS